MNKKNYSKKEHYSIRKLSIGAASVLIGLSFVGMQNTVVHADAKTPAETQTDSQKGVDPTKQNGSTDINTSVSVKPAEPAQQNQSESEPVKQEQSADKIAQNTQTGNNDKKKVPAEIPNTKSVKSNKTAQPIQAINNKHSQADGTKSVDTENFNITKAKQSQSISKDQLKTSLFKSNAEPNNLSNAKDVKEIKRTYYIYINPPYPKYGKRYLSAIWQPVFDLNSSYDSTSGKTIYPSDKTNAENWSINFSKSKFQDCSQGGLEWAGETEPESPHIQLYGYKIGSRYDITDDNYYKPIFQKDGSYLLSHQFYDHGIYVEPSGAINFCPYEYIFDKNGNETGTKPLNINNLKPDGNIELGFIGLPQASSTTLIGSGYHNSIDMGTGLLNDFYSYLQRNDGVDTTHKAIFGTYDNPKFDFDKFKAFVKQNTNNGWFNDPASMSQINWMGCSTYQEYSYDARDNIEKDNNGDPIINQYPDIVVSPDLLDSFKVKNITTYIAYNQNYHLTQEQAQAVNWSNWNKDEWWTQWVPASYIADSGIIKNLYGTGGIGFIVLEPKTNKKILKKVISDYQINGQMPNGTNQNILDYKPEFDYVEFSNAVTKKEIGTKWELTTDTDKSGIFNPHKDGYSDNWDDILNKIKGYGLNVSNQDNNYYLTDMLANKDLKNNNWTIVYTALPKKPDTPQGSKTHDNQLTSGQSTSGNNNVQPTKPTAPAKPTKPVAPTKPVSPSQPTQGKKPVKTKKPDKKQNKQKPSKTATKPSNTKPAKTNNTHVKNNKPQKSNTTALPASKPSYNYNNSPHSEIVNGNRTNPSSNVMPHSQINPTSSNVMPHGESSLNSENATPETYNVKPGAIGSHVAPNGEVLPEGDIIAQNGMIINIRTHKIVGYLDKNGQPHIALPQTGAKSSSKLALLGSALVSLTCLISIVSLLGGDRKKNK